jgi:hypothetical protein
MMASVCLPLVVAVAIGAQAGQPAPAPPGQTQDNSPASGDPTSLARIRRGLLITPVMDIHPAHDPVKFRVSIEGRRPLLVLPAWDPSDAVPDYVRTTRPLYHHEFLQMVTPEEFRSGVLYPGVDVLGPAQALISGIRDAIRRRREQAVRQRIKEELRLLEAARNPQKPPP